MAVGRYHQEICYELTVERADKSSIGGVSYITFNIDDIGIYQIKCLTLDS